MLTSISIAKRVEPFSWVKEIKVKEIHLLFSNFFKKPIFFLRVFFRRRMNTTLLNKDQAFWYLLETGKQNSHFTRGVAYAFCQKQ